MAKDLRVVSAIATIVEDPDTTPMSVRPHTKEKKTCQKEEVVEKNHLQEREGVEINRCERRTSRMSNDTERKDNSSRSYTKRGHQAHVGEWVSGSDSDHHSERSYHSDSEYTQDEVLPV